ncbi:MAG: AAA family ATPase [Rhodobacteraceae bacterium]|nr:AAA family ATPase [Paracoccaceae bacterium]
MTTGTALNLENAVAVTACTVSSDPTDFELLAEDMFVEFDDKWTALDFSQAAHFLAQPSAGQLEVMAVAVTSEDEAQLHPIVQLVRDARAAGVQVVLVAEGIGPIALHQLMRAGAEDFIPYPLPEGALSDTLDRLRARSAPVAPAAPAPAAPAQVAPASGREGVILPVHGLSGGVGATTFSVNLAWELALLGAKQGQRVALIDLDFQYGAVATYLDLPRRDAVFELLSDAQRIDAETLGQAMEVYHDQLHVLTAPSESLPLDFVGPADIARLLEVATDSFDLVVVDMPSTLVAWTETVLNLAPCYFALIEMDMRSAQNTLRFIRLLKAEELPHEKVRYILNRAPGFADLSGKSRVKRLAESLSITLEVQLADGGKAVTHANDHGAPLAEAAKKNALRKDILKMASSVHALAAAEPGKS